MKSIFVHIGTHKTGTTTIQAFLRGSADELHDRGIYVPSSGTIGRRAGHHNIGWQLRTDPRFNPKHGTVADLISELDASEAEKAVISSEDFEYLVDRLDRLSEFENRLIDSGWLPTYVLLLRRQDVYALSLYEELKKHGLRCSFTRFLLQVLLNKKFTMRGDWCFYFDFDEFVQRWQSATRGQLVVRSFDRAVAGYGLIPTFLETIGIEKEGIGANLTLGPLNKRQTTISPATEAVVRWALRRRFPSNGHDLAA